MTLLFWQAIGTTNCHQAITGGSKDRTEGDWEQRGERSWTVDTVVKERTVDAVQFDFSRAFDKVSQRLLAATLVKRGLDKWMIRWMENWLAHQAGRVRFWSVVENATGGWCHSQMLVPIQFNVLIYNLENGMKCTLRKLYFPAVLGAFFTIDWGSFIIKNT